MVIARAPRVLIGLLAACLSASGCVSGNIGAERRVFQAHNLLRHAGYTGLGPIVSGELAEDEPRRVEVTLREGACYVVAAFGSVEVTDLSLVVHGPDESALAEDSGLGATAAVSFCAEETGAYGVTLTADGSGGGYHLTHWQGSSSAGGGAVTDGGAGLELVVGRTVSGELPTGQPYVDYTLRVERMRTFDIDLMSDDFDCYLYLLENGTEIDRDDDGGMGLNSRMTTPLGPGLYTVRVSSFGNSGSGQFTLTVR